ncbi:MAG TPA: penicillin acylase family protein [Mycobacteriales bacterium]|nr:penicillin acylase family protein [Mycobacteriales bacterium]
MRTRLVPLLLVPLLSVPFTASPALAADVPPAQPAEIGTALPPGNSGFFSVEGQARGTATGDPGDYGEHVDDQREMFWGGEYKDGRFTPPTGTPQTPRDGVRIYEDDKGVPVVYGDTAYDVWFGAGYAAGQQRLFLADAVRRLGRGTFAELVGPSGVPDDALTRTVTYSQADYDRMFAALPAESREVVEGYAAGLDAWIRHVRTTPSDLPAEYVLLSSLPERWTVTDTLAAGVLITRTVASAGGNEFDHVDTLRDLGGLDALDPADADPPVLPTGVTAPEVPTAVAASARAAVEALNAWGRGLHGGSYMFAVAPERTSTGGAMLVSGPQLGYSYPTQLWEVEVHGAGFDARGSTVPGLPTVGIGYGERVAWGLTTGNSKTIDSFIETVRREGGRLQYLHGAPGSATWKDADCRVETIRYRGSTDPDGSLPSVPDAPAGPAVFTEDVEVCRTVHGPIVSYSDDGTLARSVQYAMYGRELETVNGILAWNKADSFEEFEAGVRQVAWNENVVYADADGRIAYWHPGLFPKRSGTWDTRFPRPGTGEHDSDGFLPFEQMPHVVDPDRGWVANWNGKPAAGWQDDYLDLASSRPAGRAQRVQVIDELLESQPRLTPEALRATEYRLGVVDQRAPEFLPLAQGLTGATPLEQAAVELLRGWDGTAYGPGAGTSEGEYTDESVTAGPAPTVFWRFMDALRDEALADLPTEVVDELDEIASHVWDASAADNLVLRLLAPERSSLEPPVELLGGRTPAQVLQAALTATVAELRTAHGDDPAAWRDRHPRRDVNSLTGVIGPSLTMPYQDRGSWVHVVAFDGAGGPAMPTPTPTTAAAPLPRTGPASSTTPPTSAQLAGAWALRRRRGVLGSGTFDDVADDDLAG